MHEAIQPVFRGLSWILTEKYYAEQVANLQRLCEIGTTPGDAYRLEAASATLGAVQAARIAKPDNIENCAD